MILSNCSAPTSAFLGPIFTGAKTGSIYQASLSYGTNRIIDKIKEENQANNLDKNGNFLPKQSAEDRKPFKLIAYCKTFLIFKHNKEICFLFKFFAI